MPALFKVSFFTVRPLAPDPRATAHHLALSARIASFVPLSAAQQSHQLAPSSLARFVRAPPASLEPLVSSASFESASLAQSTNSAKNPLSGHLLAPLALPALSVALLPSHLQYALQYSQSALRVASTVEVPAALQSGTTQAFYAYALPATSQHATRSQLAPYQLEAAVVQPAAQVGAPDAHGAHLTRIVGAQFM